MNIENAKKLRDLIASLPPEQTNMIYWSSLNNQIVLQQSDHAKSTVDSAAECGTVACIAGWAFYLTPVKERTTFNETGQVFLQISDEEADRLFMVGADNTTAYYEDRSSVTKEQMVEALDQLINTGEFSWERILGSIEDNPEHWIHDDEQ